MEDNGLPAVGQLEATPEILRGLMRELTEEDARWKPAPDRFSVAEVLAHLSALARNDPTLLAKNVQHHAKLVPHLPVGKSILLPRGKSTGRQLTCISALDRPVRPRHLVQEAERLTRALGVDDGKITPHACGVDDNAGP